jgi:hypothetical protein
MLYTLTQLFTKIYVYHTRVETKVPMTVCTTITLHHLQKRCENIATYSHVGRAKPRYCGTDTAPDCLRATIPRHSAAIIAAEVGTKITHARVTLRTFTKILLTCTYTYIIHIHEIKTFNVSTLVLNN